MYQKFRIPVRLATLAVNQWSFARSEDGCRAADSNQGDSAFMSEPLLYEQDGGVVTLTMNRPDVRNALSGTDMIDAFVEAARRVNADRSVRADGFDAKWKVSYYGRNYPQAWTSRTGNERFTTNAV